MRRLVLAALLVTALALQLWRPPLALAGQPDQVIVQMALGNNPLDTTYTWTDVSAYCRNFRTKRGRQHELNRSEAGQFSGLFTNRDARFYAWNQNSPYWPNLKMMVPLRVQAVASAVTYNVWQGFVTAMRNVWSDAANTDMTIEATGGFRALDLLTLQSPYYYAVLTDSPSEWYRLQEMQATSGTTTAIDYSGNGRNGTYAPSAVAYQVTSPIADSTAKAITVSGTVGLGAIGNVSIPTVALPGAFSVEAWINTTTTGPIDSPFLEGVMYPPNVPNPGTLWYWLLEASPSRASFIIQDTSFGGAFAAATSSAAINDGKWHHVVGTRDGSGNLAVYVDGVLGGTAASGSLAFNATAIMDVGGGQVGQRFAGSIAEPAVYAGTVLSGARVAAHYTAGLGRVGDLTGTRIGWVLDQASWPSALRALDAGQDSMVAVPAPVGALSHILDATTSETGNTFESGAGKITFYERDHTLKPPFTTSQATFGDGNLPYLLAGTELALDELDIYNAAQITPSGGGPVLSSDSSSKTQYIARTLTKNLLTASPLVAQDAANWEVTHYKQPYQRVRSITVDALSNPSLMWPQMLGRELWDRVTVQRNFFPVNPGSPACTPFSQDYLIEGIEHTWSADPGKWTTLFRLSPAETQTYFILDHATLGKLDSANILAY